MDFANSHEFKTPCAPNSKTKGANKSENSGAQSGFQIWWKTLLVGILLGLIVAGLVWYNFRGWFSSSIDPVDSEPKQSGSSSNRDACLDDNQDHITYVKQMRALADERSEAFS